MSGITLPEKWTESTRGIAFRDRTPLHRTATVVVFTEELNTNNSHFREPIKVRWYWGNGETCRCIVWIHDQVRGYSHGVGSARGYGYDKESAALSSALHDLGIRLGEYECNARGMDASRYALTKIAEIMGFTNIHIVEGHA